MENMESFLCDKLKQSSLTHLCLAIIFFTSGIIINIGQLILFCTIRPFSKRLFRKINCYLHYGLHSQGVFLAEWWSNSKIILYVDKDEWKKYYGKEHGFVIMNHGYETDWLFGWVLIEKLNLLGTSRAYCKKDFKWMPVLGWQWMFSECVFLERDFQKDKKSIHKQVSACADFPDPMWLLLYPEGTRFTEEKHKASVEYARKNNLPELKYHLMPRTKGFIASMPALRGKYPAIYDYLTMFKEDEEIKPTIMNIFFGKSVTAHIYLRRIPLEEVPETEEGQDKFIKDLFITKDKMKESFLKYGDFFKLTDDVQRVEPFSVGRGIYPLLNVIIWTSLTLIPMAFYLFKLLLNGQIFYFSIAAGTLTIFFFLMNNLTGRAERKKGSSYGIDTKDVN